MLEIARARNEREVSWQLGHAEAIPLSDAGVDLVFMSQVFHHLRQPHRALQEIDRVLTPQGYLAIRNGTRESDRQIPWLRFFPAAQELAAQRMLSRQELTDRVCSQHFQLVGWQEVEQVFATSAQEYLQKIGQRGLSLLIDISDEEFERGLERLAGWSGSQPHDQPIYDPVDLFILQKK